MAWTLGSSRHASVAEWGGPRDRGVMRLVQAVRHAAAGSMMARMRQESRTTWWTVDVKLRAGPQIQREGGLVVAGGRGGEGQGRRPTGVASAARRRPKRAPPGRPSRLGQRRTPASQRRGSAQRDGGRTHAVIHASARSTEGHRPGCALRSASTMDRRLGPACAAVSCQVVRRVVHWARTVAPHQLHHASHFPPCRQEPAAPLMLPNDNRPVSTSMLHGTCTT